MKKRKKKLTANQQPVANALASDYGVKEAAAHLGKRTRTVEGIVDRIKDKFEVKTLQGLIAELVRHDCIDVHSLKKKQR